MALADSNVATVYITVYATPVANDDHYSAIADQELDVNAANGVLANDTNADGNPLTSVLVAGPANGSLTLNSDGSFSYLPDSGFYGEDSFTYYDVNGPLTPIRPRSISPSTPLRWPRTITTRTWRIKRSPCRPPICMSAAGPIHLVTPRWRFSR